MNPNEIRPDMTKDTLMRVVIAQQIQNFIDNVDYMWNEDKCEEGLPNLIQYANEHGADVPKIPIDEERRKDTIKTLYRFWAARETLSLQVAILGVQNEP